MLWWLAVALAVAGAVTAVLQHRSISRRLLVVVLVFAGHGAAQWHRLATPQVGNFSGSAVARSDAGNRNGAVSLIVSVDDEKFRLTVYGRERGALRRVRMGDTVILDEAGAKFQTPMLMGHWWVFSKRLERETPFFGTRHVAPAVGRRAKNSRSSI
jgi:hypothetical protein